MDYDRAGLADFLRRRRDSLRPADLGLPEGGRRRAPGLRREEVTALAGMSPDYYIRLEQARGPQPSEQMLNALVRALRLTRDERDHLFHLAGHSPPARYSGGHVAPGLLSLLDRLATTPAEIVSDLGEVLAQNDLAVALLGDQVAAGAGRGFTYQWFTDPEVREIYPVEDRDHHSRIQVADLRAAVARRPRDAVARELVGSLRAASEEFAALWKEHNVAVRREDHKRIVHPVLGVIEVDCQVLLNEAQDQRLVVISAPPGSEAAEQLAFLAVLGPRATSDRAGE